MKFTLRSAWQYFRARFEAFVWISALVLLAFMPPTEEHVSLCPFRATGLGFCPGCGLGHAISWLFRGDLLHSFQAHPLGIVAVIVLILRIIVIFRKPVFYY